MEEITKPKIKPVKKVCITDTLKLMGIGDTIQLLFRDAKPNSIRQVAKKLSPKKFEISEAGQVDRTIITRIL
jgi:hypothetical protein